MGAAVKGQKDSCVLMYGLAITDSFIGILSCEGGEKLVNTASGETEHLFEPLPTIHTFVAALIPSSRFIKI